MAKTFKTVVEEGVSLINPGPIEDPLKGIVWVEELETPSPGPGWKENIGGGWQIYKDFNPVPMPTPSKKVKESTFNPGDTKDIKEIVDKLIKLGAFFHGSRQKMSNYNYSSKTDWDFAISEEQSEEEDIKDFILSDFTASVWDEEYNGSYMKMLYKHTNFPHITIQVKKNLEVYKKVWNRMPFEYWYSYLWKSAPHAKADYPWKCRAQDTWRMLEEMLSIREVEEWL